MSRLAEPPPRGLLIASLITIVASIAIIAAVLLWPTSDEENTSETDEGGPVDELIDDELPGRLVSTPEPGLLERPDVDEVHLGPIADGGAPGIAPLNAAGALTGVGVPTNQWWSALLTSDSPPQVWAQPITVHVVDGGLDLDVPVAEGTGQAVVAPFISSLELRLDTESPSDLSVVRAGAFDVDIEVATNQGGVMAARVAQGVPLIEVSVTGGSLSARAAPSADGSPAASATELADDHWTIVGGDQTWDLFIDSSWTAAADAALARDGSRVVVAARPPDADPAAWIEAVRAAAEAPLEATRETMSIDEVNGRVLQRLEWDRSDPRVGLVGTLPHHRSGSVGSLADSLGGWSTARGRVEIHAGDTVTWAAPLTGFIPGVVPIEMSSGEAAELSDQVANDLAAGEAIPVDSYFGPKALSRLATLTELGRTLEPNASVVSGLDMLTEGVIDRLTYSGTGDDRWPAWDPVWGGVIAQPPAFGSQDYNDHHFHYGYLVHAAAVVAELVPGFVAEHGMGIELLIADMRGGGDGFPFQRVRNPWLGHSHASGFAPFADGNNQESSSEAVHAWWSVARWGLAAGDADVADWGLAAYAIEAATARAYWLGEGIERPAGYDHQVAGIVFDGKIDFATWFDPDPAKVVGIQLLPFTFGSLYRFDPAAAAARWEESTNGLATPASWVDLAAMDLALSDPAQAAGVLDTLTVYEEGNSAAFARYWVTALSSVGLPHPDISTRPAGLGQAFVLDGSVTFTAMNPTSDSVEVEFLEQGRPIGVLALEPGQRATTTDLS